jgi:hypothetical protein
MTEKSLHIFPVHTHTVTDLFAIRFKIPHESKTGNVNTDSPCSGFVDVAHVHMLHPTRSGNSASKRFTSPTNNKRQAARCGDGERAPPEADRVHLPA